MASVSAIATAMGTALSAAGIRAVPYLGDQVNPPVAVVATMGVEYHGAFGVQALATHSYTVMLIVAKVADRSALTALEGYMSNAGTTSVTALLEADQTLGGTAEGVIVRRSHPPVALSVSGVEYTSVPFDVDVFAA